VRVEVAPRLDGTLNDPLWQLAKPVNGFRQKDPDEGQPATEPTEVRLLYTRTAAYFGIDCQDSAPSLIVASELRRDAEQHLDDHFEIMIDPDHDRRDAYVFETNPLGAQRDGVITEESAGGGSGQDFDPGWDGVWRSEARITNTGWTATVEIPFSTLNFTQSKDVVWGLNFKRFIRHKNEEDLWSAYQRPYGLTKVSQAGELDGITNIGSGRIFIVKPYVLGGFDRLTGSGTSMLHTGGLDIKYGISSSLVANLTGNTDFADAEVDQQQFNLTPFKLFFPEKRQFFLENEGIFDFATGDMDRLFFSRTIGIDPVSGEVVPINGGAKITGTIGKYQVGLMEVDTRSSGPNPYANYAVARVKRALFGDSYIGVMAIDKRSGNQQDRYNQSLGADARLVFFKNLALHGWAAQTRTPGLSGGQTNVGGIVTYRTDWLRFAGEQNKIGANYNPEVGFIERTNSNQSYLELNLTPHPHAWKLRELNFEGFLFHAPDTHGVVQTQEYQGTFRAMLGSGAYTDDDLWDVTTQRLTTPFNIYKSFTIPVGLYHFARHQIAFGSGEDQRFTFGASERFGSYYTGSLNEFHVRGKYRPNERLSFSLEQQWNRFRLPQGNFSVDLALLEANYSFSRFLSLDNFLQLDTSNAQAVSANIRLRFNYRPDSDLFIIYNAGPQFVGSATTTNPPQLREQKLAIKFTYSFQPLSRRVTPAKRTASFRHGDWEEAGLR
jgi:hypothetical protein